MARVSVIVPLYNKAEHVLRAINSVLAQTEQEFEIVVINDASTDGGERIVENLKHKQIKLFYRKQPGPGGHAARNLGIKEAKTDLIVFLDADDAYKPNFLEIVLHLENKFPGAGAYCTAYEIIEPSGKVTKPRFRAIPSSPWEGFIPSYFESVLGLPPVITSAAAVPKKVFNEVGFFPEGEKMGGDLDMWLRIALRYPIAYNNSIGTSYYKNAINRICTTQYSIDEYLFIKTAKKAILNDQLSKRNKFFLSEYINMKEIDRAGRCLIKGENKKARRILLINNTVFFKRKKVILLFLSFLPRSFNTAIAFFKKKLLGKI